MLVTSGDNKQIAMLHMESVDHTEKNPNEGFDHAGSNNILLLRTGAIGDREMSVQQPRKPGDHRALCIHQFRVQTLCGLFSLISVLTYDQYVA